MQKPDEKRQPATTPAPAARRVWSAPKLVEYGHLAKLTRGASGGFPDTGHAMKTMCL